MYTPLNQYHVVMEVAPQYWQNPSALHDIYVRSRWGRRYLSARWRDMSRESTLLAVNHQGQFPAVTLLIQYGARTCRWGRPWRRSRGRCREIGLPAGDPEAVFRERRKRLSIVARESPAV